MIEVIDIDRQLTSKEFIADPYPVYRALRGTDPVYYSKAWGVWVLTRYDDIVPILRDPQHFSNSGRFAALLDQLPADVQQEMAPLRQHYSAGMIQADPPDHTRLRALVRDAFSARVIQNIRPHVQAIVDDLIDQFDKKGQVDIIRNLAYPLPVIVISELLGVPVEDRDRFLIWSHDLTGLQATGGANADYARRAARAVQELEEYFRQICAERRRSPRNDLISQMIAAQESGDKLSEDELINMCVTFLIAGHETTKSLIGNGILTLINHPSDLEELSRDPSLMATAVEEILRYESPIQRAWRRVTEDVEVGGRQIRAGELVFLMLGSANRDPSHFPDPDRFDIRRSDNHHVAFGYGVHFCIGAPLARVEAPIAIGTVLRRLRNLRLEQPVEWYGSIHVRGPNSLHLAFESES
jgi:cytochrome P450